jgi:hypothetical protein
MQLTDAEASYVTCTRIVINLMIAVAAPHIGGAVVIRDLPRPLIVLQSTICRMKVRFNWRLIGARGFEIVAHLKTSGSLSLRSRC